MSNVWIVILLLVPVITIIVLTVISGKKKKKAIELNKSRYLNRLLEEYEFVPAFEKQLAFQHLMLDESTGRVLVVDHRQETPEHFLHSVKDLKIKVSTVKDTVYMDSRQEKTEHVISRIGLELESPQASCFLVFFDHTHHNVFMLKELEREAHRLKDRLSPASGMLRA
jgi:hypothetical protein